MFYEKGLNFSCTQCGSCCRHDPGYVFLTNRDVERLHKGLDISRKLFIEKYCRTIDINGFKRISLIEKKNYDCVFWKSEQNDGVGGCSVYHYRPVQCSTYPFWSNNLHSKEVWNALKDNCPGINQGKLHSKQEIDEYIDKRNSDPLIVID